MHPSLVAALLTLLTACGDPAPVNQLPDAPPSPDARLPPDAPLPSDAPDVRTLIQTDFEGPVPPQIDAGTGSLTPTQGFSAHGFDGTFLRSQTGNSITITISELPPHTKLSIGFLFAAIDSLDGTGAFPAGDFMRITLDGTQIFRESFANATLDQIQSYVPPPGGELARRVDLGFGGPGGYYTDSAYDMTVDPQFQNLPHTSPTATLVFQLEGEGVQSLDDESWAIDNLRVDAF